MHPQAHIPGQSSELDRPLVNKLRLLFVRKIWLPKSIYAILPLLYLGLGLYAIGAALLLSHWSWIVPYILIFGIVLLHTGARIAAMRWRNRNGPAVKPVARHD
jgi:hypothetical protein